MPVFIPGQNQPDLLGTVMQFKQFQQGQQRLGLLQQDAERQTQELVRKQKTEKLKFLMDSLPVFKDRESVVKNMNALGQELGLPELSVPQDPKEMIREANEIRKFMNENPNADPRPLLQQFSSKYASLEGRQAQLDLLGKDISYTKAQMADQYLSLLEGSGGIRPEERRALLETFARSGGTPELRSAAANRLMEQAKLAEQQSKSQATLGAGQTRFDVTGKPIASVPATTEKTPNVLEDARNAFVNKTATPEQRALINQDEGQYVKDYLQVYQGSAVTDRQIEPIRKRAEILYRVERLQTNPLPSNIKTASEAVKYLTGLGFDPDAAKETTRQILLFGK